MHWAMKTAESIIERYPNEEVYVCASGISPTSEIHIGNFREAVTTYFVTKALAQLGKRTRFIFSWDDYDVFKRVPDHLPSTLSHYIGMPLIDVPDPFGCHQSFAAHFENEFEEALNQYGIHPEFINQSTMYKSGVYNEDVRLALKRRHEIYDLLHTFDGQKDEAAREVFYPITLYCRNCLTNHTTITGYDPETDVVQYHCTCGHQEVAELESINRIKLTWKADWAMRWKHERVCFEPGGHKHSVPGGSYDISKLISEQIFNRKAPFYMPYDHTGIKSKISPKTGNLITPKDLLEVYPPEIVLYLYSKYNADHAFDIGMDEEVVRNYSEFEQISKQYHEGRIADEDLKFALELSNITRSASWFGPRFSVIASALPLLNDDLELMQTLLLNETQTGEMSEASVKEKVLRASYWISKWQPEQKVAIKTTPEVKFINNLNQDERLWLQNFKALLEQAEDVHSDLFLNQLATMTDTMISGDGDWDKAAFRLIYQLTIGQNTGPQIPMLIEIMGKESLIALLNKI
ncbi:MAG: lysyl-tRNA synthetase, class [Clostridiales bacterium]|nr:lysyl-tRNA synthetase, class [Clostridiales bacterium]